MLLFALFQFVSRRYIWRNR